MRRVRAVEKQWVLQNLSVYICSLRYPACNGHAPYFHVACPALKYFSIFSYKRHDFRKKKILSTKCLFCFSLRTLSATHLNLRRNERVKIKNVYWSSCKVPLLFFDFNETWIFYANFRKILQYQISWRSARWEPRCSVRTNKRTDMTKLIGASSNFANAPKHFTK